MERPDTSASSARVGIRTLRRAPGGIIYHAEADEWRNAEHQMRTDAQEPMIPLVNSTETMDLLASSARNSSTPIRPYYHHYTSERTL
jgi:hypothetical protein